MSISIPRARTRRPSIWRSAFEGGAPAYEPGDSLDLYPENDPAYVDELLKLAGLAGDEKLRSDFIKSRDVTTLSLKTVETYAETTGHHYVKALIADGQAREWIAGRQLIDLIATFPIALDAETAARADAAACAARLFDRVLARARSATRRICSFPPCATTATAARARASPRTTSPSASSAAAACA